MTTINAPSLTQNISTNEEAMLCLPQKTNSTSANKYGVVFFFLKGPGSFQLFSKRNLYSKYSCQKSLFVSLVCFQVKILLYFFFNSPPSLISDVYLWDHLLEHGNPPMATPTKNNDNSSVQRGASRKSR